MRAKDAKALDELGQAVAGFIDQHPEKFDEDITTTITSTFPLKGEEPSRSDAK